MIDINLLRSSKGGNPDLVRESQRKRGGEEKVKLIDEIIDMDENWIKARFNADEINRDLNKIGSQLKDLAKSKKKDTDEWNEAQNLKKQLEIKKQELNNIANEKEVELFKKLSVVGNIVHDTVINSLTEDDNGIVKNYWPEGRNEQADLDKKSKISKKDIHGVPGLYSHHALLQKIGGYDPIRGTKVAGHRGYFLMGPGYDLQYAVVRYALDLLDKKGFTKVQTPFFMRKELMSKTAQLEDFDEALYKLGESGTDDETDEKYLIATSEQPISAFHANEWFSQPNVDLPKKYSCHSSCFRKEAGAHGRDTWGIFRVHQFEKVEQFVLTEPEKSWEMHEEMLNNAEELYQSLKIPYRVVNIVSGALNNAAAKKYDLEGWFPFQGTYKELVSCSNCTDYQSRSLEIRIGTKKNSDVTKTYAHALNSTMAATTRVICAILENYQTEDGVIIPEPLRPYLGNKEFYPFIN